MESYDPLRCERTQHIKNLLVCHYVSLIVCRFLENSDSLSFPFSLSVYYLTLYLHTPFSTSLFFFISLWSTDRSCSGRRNLFLLINPNNCTYPGPFRQPSVLLSPKCQRFDLIDLLSWLMGDRSSCAPVRWIYPSIWGDRRAILTAPHPDHHGRN